MTISEFRGLPTAAQLRELQQNGVYVGKRKQGEKAVLLYQLHSYYGEIWYTNYRLQADEVVVSESLALLEPYLDQVCIELEPKGF